MRSESLSLLASARGRQQLPALASARDASRKWNAGSAWQRRCGRHGWVLFFWLSRRRSREQAELREVALTLQDRQRDAVGARVRQLSALVAVLFERPPPGDQLEIGAPRANALAEVTDVTDASRP